MRQELTFNPVIRGWIFLLICMSVALIYTACQTNPIHDFSKIQNNMSKDEVLNIIGSPNRTERIDGKEKWAYRFWNDDAHRTEVLDQVTFLNGRVINAGEDADEVQRLKDIEQDDAKKAERRKALKARALNPNSPDPLAPPSPVSVQVTDPPAKPVIEEDFIEQKGKSN
jgi:outer membrane protein assembly factor BamE